MYHENWTPVRHGPVYSSISLKIAEQMPFWGGQYHTSRPIEDLLLQTYAFIFISAFHLFDKTSCKKSMSCSPKKHLHPVYTHWIMLVDRWVWGFPTVPPCLQQISNRNAGLNSKDFRLLAPQAGRSQNLPITIQKTQGRTAGKIGSNICAYQTGFSKTGWTGGLIPALVKHTLTPGTSEEGTP